MSRRLCLFALVALSAFVSSAALASAAGPLTVGPAKATPDRALTVTWTPPRAVLNGARIVATTLPDTGCTSRASVAVSGAVPAGRAVRVRLVPRPRWCVRRVLRIAVTRAGTTLAVARVRVGTPVQVRVLSGTVTTSVAGRPDRAAVLTGQLRGGIPGPHFRLDGDITSSVDISELDLAAPPADPACTPEGTFPRRLPVAPGGSMTLRASGLVTAPIRLAVPPAALTGCAAAPGGPATTEVTMNGDARIVGGLGKLAVTGTIPGVALAGGVTATVTISAVVSVSLGGER